MVPGCTQGDSAGMLGTAESPDQAECELPMGPLQTYDPSQGCQLSVSLSPGKDKPHFKEMLTSPLYLIPERNRQETGV